MLTPMLVGLRSSSLLGHGQDLRTRCPNDHLSTLMQSLESLKCRTGLPILCVELRDPEEVIPESHILPSLPHRGCYQCEQANPPVP